MGEVRKEFVTQRRGRSFILYHGLVDLAHQDGLKGIESTLVVEGSEANGFTWIFKATVETSKGRFSAHGDASPNNVGSGMVTVLPRLAETRAVARALRGAVNNGMTTLEEGDEVGGDEDVPEGRTFGGRPTEGPKAAVPSGPVTFPVDRMDPQPKPPPAAPKAQARPPGSPPASDLATEAQVGAIYAIARSHDLEREDIDEQVMGEYGVPLKQLTRRQASDLITRLKK